MFIDIPQANKFDHERHEKHEIGLQNEPFNDGPGIGSEVYQQADLDVGRLQVVQELGFVFCYQVPHSL